MEIEIAGKRFKVRELTGEEAMLTVAVAVICTPSVREYLSETIRLNLPEEKAFTILTFVGQMIIGLLDSTDNDDIIRHIRENEEKMKDSLSASGVDVPKLLEGYEGRKEAEHGDDNQH